MPHPDADRGSATISIAVGAAVVILLLAALIGGIAGTFGQQASACTAQPGASGAAAAIPSRYLADYKKAGTQYSTPWTVLAGIGTVESDNGQSNQPGVHSGANSFGAAGPMQFGVGGAAGNTWGGAPVHPASQHTGGYGIDGDHDGLADVYDPGDAIPSAARFLQAHGAPGSMQAALFAFNHSSSYVSDVLGWAARYAAGGGQAISAASSPLCQQAALGPLPPGAAGKVLAYAAAQLGKPYLFGGTGPDAYDCSGSRHTARWPASCRASRGTGRRTTAGPAGALCRRLHRRCTRPRQRCRSGDRHTAARWQRLGRSGRS
jgi:cell wall-associated NlpC family hydrolase